MGFRFCKTAAVALLVCCTTPALAAFHLMQIEQVIAGVGGDTTAQAIQLRMRASGQNLVSNARIRAFDAAGLNPVLIVDMTTNVTNFNLGDRVLITTAAFNSYTSPTCVPNFTMTNPIPVSYLAAGSLMFEDDGGTQYWRLSWGGAAYTGSNTATATNDADGNFGPPFGSALPSTTNNALRFTGTASALSTTNLANYAIDSVPSVFTNNARNTFTITVGACCQPNGSCLGFQKQATCVAGGGTYQGNNTACGSVNCSATSGACCQPSGVCNTAATAADCTGGGGTFQGVGSDCGSVNCPQPPGACCAPNGNCTFVTAVNCAAGGGSFQGVGVTCGSANCPVLTGACCATNGSCSSITPADCLAIDGDFQGVGAPCDPNPCPVVPTGACCMPNGGCEIHDGTDCAEHGGAYGGDNTTCLTVTCTCRRGDANCDGSVNNFDIDYFVYGILLDQTSYLGAGGTQSCWDERSCWGDLGCDLAFNNFDIDPFVACILNLPPAGEPCICPGG